MAPAVKDKQQEIVQSLGQDITEGAATLAAPPPEMDRAEMRELMAEVAALRAQVQQMTQGTVPVSPAAVAASSRLEAVEQQRDEDRLRAAHALEPKVTVQLQPDELEQAVLARRRAKDPTCRDFPPRRFLLNGVPLWVQVGRPVQVPESVAQVIEHSREIPLLDLTPAGEQQVGYWLGDGVPGA